MYFQGRKFQKVVHCI
nr:unnamed protein product [Callosobruchus analis]